MCDQRYLGVPKSNQKCAGCNFWEAGLKRELKKLKPHQLCFLLAKDYVNNSVTFTTGRKTKV